MTIKNRERSKNSSDPDSMQQSRQATHAGDSINRRTALKTIVSVGALTIGSRVASADERTSRGGKSDIAVYIYQDDSFNPTQSWHSYVSAFCDELPNFFYKYLDLTADYNNRIDKSVPFKEYWNRNDKSRKNAFPSHIWNDAEHVYAGVLLEDRNEPLGLAENKTFMVNNLVDLPIDTTIPKRYRTIPERYKIPMLMHETGHLFMDGDPDDEHGRGAQYRIDPLHSKVPPSQPIYKISAMAAGYTVIKLSDHQQPETNCQGDNWRKVIYEPRNPIPYNAYSQCTINSIAEKYENARLCLDMPYVFEGPTNDANFPPDGAIAVNRCSN